MPSDLYVPKAQNDVTIEQRDRYKRALHIILEQCAEINHVLYLCGWTRTNNNIFKFAR